MAPIHTSSALFTCDMVDVQMHGTEPRMRNSHHPNQYPTHSHSKNSHQAERRHGPDKNWRLSILHRQNHRNKKSLVPAFTNEY